jgi:hypothetical protein
MTEQEITQARADLAQLDIEQLRCGVMLQLLKIEELTNERDAWVERHKACVKCLGEALQDTTDVSVERDRLQYEVDAIPAIKAERDALAAAAKLALDSAVDVYATCDRYGDGDQKAMESLSKAIEALRQAGVQ